jgi:hypothetical protein
VLVVVTSVVYREVLEGVAHMDPVQPVLEILLPSVLLKVIPADLVKMAPHIMVVAVAEQVHQDHLDHRVQQVAMVLLQQLQEVMLLEQGVVAEVVNPVMLVLVVLAVAEDLVMAMLAMLIPVLVV